MDTGRSHRCPIGPTIRCNAILFAESAAAFEELTLSRQVDQLKAQVPDAWPNALPPIAFRLRRRFRAGRSFPPRRSRRRWQRVLSAVDLLLVPSLRDEMLTIGNFTGHPR